MADFTLAFNYTIQNEGTHFTDNPHDIGRATKYGITQALLASVNGTASTEDVKNLTLEQAKQVYEKVFWLPMELDKVESQGVAMAIFDMGVNISPLRAIKLLQVSAGLVQDGIMGPATLKVINSHKPISIIHPFMLAVQHYYYTVCSQNPSQQVFLAGWMNRSNKLMSLT